MTEDTRVILADFSGKPIYWDHVVEPLAKELTLAVFVFDFTNRATFEWVRATASKMRSGRVAKFGRTLLLGNKTDVLNKVVTVEEAQLLAKEIGGSFHAVSIKDPEAVLRAFDELLEVQSIPKR
jgi:hypothetical protein